MNKILLLQKLILPLIFCVCVCETYEDRGWNWESKRKREGHCSFGNSLFAISVFRWEKKSNPAQEKSNTKCFAWMIILDRKEHFQKDIIILHQIKRYIHSWKEKKIVKIVCTNETRNYIKWIIQSGALQLQHIHIQEIE